MATHVALLRGINVGGRNKVPMAELRQVVTSLGHTGVTTYIQTGNVLFSTAGTSTKEVASAVWSAIADAFGIRTSVVVLTRDELAKVLQDNPYPDEPNPKLVHVVFLGAEPPTGLPDGPPPPGWAAGVPGAPTRGGGGGPAGRPRGARRQPGAPAPPPPRSAPQLLRRFG